MTGPFPKTPTFMTIDEPFRFEGDLYDIEIDGDLPKDLNGTFYRVGPDQAFPPKMGNANPFNGDGFVTSFTFRDGHCDMKARYVNTQRLQAERAARRGLFGDYRNSFTDDASVKGVNRAVANTNVVLHNGKLLAMKEDQPPYALNPETLETEGLFTFDGQMTATSFTAHPKVDPNTGEMIGYAYAAKGEATDDVAVFSFDKEGKLNWEIWFKSPYPGMIHECAISENYVILPLMPQVMDLDRLKRGGIIFQWEPTLDHYYLVVPRGGDTKDVRMFNAPNAMPGHVINAFEDNGKLYLDLPVASDNVFWFFPDKDGKFPPPPTIGTQITRWCFDMQDKNSKAVPTIISTLGAEFPHCDDRYIGNSYRYGFMQANDPTKPYSIERAGPIMGFFFNTFLTMDMSTGKADTWFAGECSSTQEPVFAPRGPSASEGEGWVIGVVNRRDEHRSDVVVLDAQRMSEGPVATLKLPIRLKYGIHGNWVPA
jgi:carotenoid cleavage dioxygenase-like enzyme